MPFTKASNTVINHGQPVEMTDTTQSADKDTGALVVKGGVGIEKNLNIGGVQKIAGTTSSTTKDTGCLVVEGGVGIEENLNIGGVQKIAGTIQSTDKDTGALIVEGGVGIEKRLSVGTAFLAPVWATAVAYIVGDVVRFDFGLYECKTAHTSGTLLTDWVTNNYWVQLNTPVKSVSGLILSNGPSDTANDITIGTGFAIDSTGMYKLELKSALTKQLDATFVVGTNAGGRDTGSYTASSEYFAWLIRRDSDGLVDVVLSLSKTSPTMPSGFTYKALLRGFRTNATPAIVNNQWLITDVVNDRAALMVVREEQPQNTGGSTYSIGAWRTRVVNTVKLNEIPGASLATNKITLPAGRYYFSMTEGHYGPSGSGFQYKLYDTTGAADVLILNSGGVIAGNSTNYASEGTFYIAATAAIEVRIYPTTDTITSGYPHNVTTEVYFNATFEKIE
jgi:hypothetical protein